MTGGGQSSRLSAMRPSEISRRRLSDHYFVCTCGLAWQGATFEVASESCTGEFLGTRKKGPRTRCVNCGADPVPETTKEAYEAGVKAWREKKRQEAEAKKRATPIPIEDLVERRLYRVHGRNLHIGVYVGPSKHSEFGHFRGIRLKFRDTFVDTEYQQELKENVRGSCYAYEDLGVDVPKHIPLHHGKGTYDRDTKREVASRPREDGSGFVNWYFVDTGEVSKDIHPYGRGNWALYYFLMGIEAQFYDRFEKMAAYAQSETDEHP